MSIFSGLSPWFITSFFLLLGLLIGSFLNVVIYRLPKMIDHEQDEAIAEVMEQKIEKKENLDFLPLTAHCPQCHHSYPWQQGIRVAQTKKEKKDKPFNLLIPPSTCTKCGHKIRWWENIPIISWLMLRGRCSSCHAPISIRYPLFEAITGLFFAIVAWQSGASTQTLLGCFFVAMAIVIAMIDWDTTWLPDNLSLSLMWSGLIAALMGWTPVTVQSSMWGAIAGYLSLWIVAKLFQLLMGKVAMANGDFKMLAALGAWFGWEFLLPILIISCTTGAIVGLALKGIQSQSIREGKYLPFGPFLAGAGLLILLVSPDVLKTILPFFFF